jgi:hypothetical protein
LYSSNITQKLKKLWIRLFTKHPYKIRTYNQLFSATEGAPIDLPESFSAILINEPGKLIIYPPAPEIESRIIERYTGDHKRYQISGIFKEQDRILYSLADGCITGNLGVVYSPEKRAYVYESAKEWFINIKDSRYTNVINFRPKTNLKGITLSCLTNGADGGFYHFLFESLTKIQFCKSLMNNIDHILFNGPCTDWKVKWTNRAGIDPKKIIWVNNIDHFQCDELLFTNRLIADQQIGSWCLSTLKSLFNVPVVVANETNFLDAKKVFLISRKGLSRDIKWEDELLTQYPFIEKIDLAQLSTAETIDKMQQATHVISPHGAGLSNIYLCRQATRILEIYPDGQTYQPCYLRICSVCKLDYSVIYLDFENKENTHAGINELKETLSAFLN